MIVAKYSETTKITNKDTKITKFNKQNKLRSKQKIKQTNIQTIKQANN